MKNLFLFLCLLAMPVFAQAQNPATVTGTLVDPSGVPFYPATVTACLTPFTRDPVVNGLHVNALAGSGGNYCPASVSTTTNGFFSMTVFPNSAITPSATQYQFTVSASGAAPPSGKGPQTYTVSVTISGTSQDVSASLNAVATALLNSGSSLSPNTPGIPSYNGPNIIYASNYGVKAQGVRFYDASFTSTSNTVTVGNNTTTESDQCVTSAMIGWLFAGQDNAASSVIAVTKTSRFSPGTTITAVASCTSFTVSNPASASCTSSNGSSLCQVVIAPNDDRSALLSAFQQILPATGSPNCGGKLVLPQGIMWISGPIQVASQCNSPGPLSNGSGAGVFIEGQGIGTVLFPAPAASAWNIATNQAAFFYNTSGNGGMHYSQFTIDGAGQLASVNSAGFPSYALALAQNSSAQYVNLYQWGIGAGISCAGGDAAEAIIDHVNIGALDAQSNGANMTGGSYCKSNDSAYFWSLTAGANMKVTGRPIWSTNDTFDLPFGGPSVSVSGATAEAWFIGDTFVANAVNQPVLTALTGGAAHVIGGYFFNPSPGSNPVALNTDSTSTISLVDSTILFNSNSGKAWTNAGNLIFHGYNNLQYVSNTNTGSIIGQSSPSFNSIPVTAAKLVLSSGWGSTAANTALSGGNAPIGFTITNSGTGQSAGPTITYTFPTPYAVSPLSCSATQTGGTNTIGTFSPSGLSATGVSFTYSLTPTASNTEIIKVTCDIP